MAIQMRRGLKANFDPQKMLPGEWAVSVDTETENQIIWMCFRAGVVKRMGTYEDFREQIMEITDEIAEEFSQTLNEIKVYMEGLRDTTEGYKDTTKTYMDTAEGYKNTSEQKATQAFLSATNAANSADLSEDYSKQAKSYAKGTGGEVRPNDDSDCAEFYYEQTKRISQGIEGIIPMGTITFAELSLPHNEIPKYMFDISDDFVTDERFKNGSGIYYGAGSNVIRTADDMWDVLAPVSVSGVKGDKETIYRQGLVNLTPADIGAATIEDLSGVNADFVGTKEELDAKLAAGEDLEGVTVFLKGVDDGGSGDGTGGGTVGDLTPNKALISDADGNVTSSTVTSAELEYLSGATFNIQEQIDNIELSGINADFVGTKAQMQEKIEAGEMKEGETIYLTDVGGGSSGGVIEGNLEPNKAVISDAEGNLVSSTVTDKEIEALSGVESNVQEQIETMGTGMQMKINEVMQQLFSSAVYIGQSFCSIPNVLKWGTTTEYMNDGVSTSGNIGKMAIYRPFTNTWEEPRYDIDNGYNYAGTIKSNQWITGTLEMCVPRFKDLTDMRYTNLSLRDYESNFVTFDWFDQWFPVGVRSNIVFDPKHSILTVGLTYKEFYKVNGSIRSPWGKAFMNIYDIVDNEGTSPSELNIGIYGGFMVNIGMDIKNYWSSLDPLQLDSLGSGFEAKWYYMFFRVIMIDWAKLFPPAFLEDEKNGYIEKYGKMFGIIYGDRFNWDHIPIDNEIKGFGAAQ